MKYLLIVGLTTAVVLAAAASPPDAIAQTEARTITVIYTGDAQGNVAPCG